MVSISMLRHDSPSSRLWPSQAPSTGEKEAQAVSTRAAEGYGTVSMTGRESDSIPIPAENFPTFRRSVQRPARTAPLASVTSAPRPTRVQDSCAPFDSQGYLSYNAANLVQSAPVAVMLSPASTARVNNVHQEQEPALVSECFQPTHRDCGNQGVQEATHELVWGGGRASATSSESPAFGEVAPNSPFRPVFHHHEAPARLWNSPDDMSFRGEYIYPEPFTLMMQGDLLSPGNKMSRMCPSYWSTYGEPTNTFAAGHSCATIPTANDPTYLPTSANYSFQAHLNNVGHDDSQQEYTAADAQSTPFIHTGSRDVAFTMQLQHHLQHVGSNGIHSDASLSSHNAATSTCGCSSCDAPLTPLASSNSGSSGSYAASTTSHCERVLSYQRIDTPESGVSEYGSSHHDISSSSENNRSPVRRPSNKKATQYELLLRWKSQGMSYKQIKTKGKFKEAESTLRGRYRTLTKPRETRVRRPVWKPIDIELLKEAVEYFEEEKREQHASKGNALPRENSRAAKTPWKKVAKYVFDRGGSYHFGNATCRKKWDEICKQG